MLISHKYRFIYTKTLKTAGTSVESFFEEFCMPDGEWEELHFREAYESSTGIIGFRGGKPPENTKWWNHMSANKIKELIGQDIWDSYFKFCTVRNPYDKCISAFCHLGSLNLDYSKAILNAPGFASMSEEQICFLEYLQNEAPMDRDKYVINHKFSMDDVIRYENLEEDIQRISKRIGVPIANKSLPKFKSGVRRKNAKIESIYTDLSREFVEKRYAFELKQFGYRFPD